MTVTPTGEASEGACAGGDGTRGGSSTARGGQSSSTSMAAAKSTERRERGKARELLNTVFSSLSLKTAHRPITIRRL
jgi:hypothetical protein